ncbi:MAG: sugar phosphate isomerase/epimerase [Acidimicrobiia bacterium]|nr:sugar phosphate isomerase/epimerase [Acidimicrobiia bacterium]
MQTPIDRRYLLAGSLGLAAHQLVPAAAAAPYSGVVTRTSGTRVKLGLNAYSFDKPLRENRVTLEQLVDFCAKNSIDALDATGYYFAGYPKAPSDETIYRLKRKAYVNGVAISFTAVKNDFTLPDRAARRKEVQHVKDWIVVASKLGAPMIRVFTGPDQVPGYRYEQVVEWMIPDFQECAAFGRDHGVVVALQNHEDFVRTADQVIGIIKAVGSEWFGSILDVGSLRRYDVYEEIQKLLPYAVSWLIKENVWYGERAVPTDLHRVKEIIVKGGYRGYLPMLTLGEGDPAQKVLKLAAGLRKEFGL